ncbi:hypothetical protein GFC01_00790 [Desulfofundulus thermobenzoicus]|uniref:Uncharacterized protein n=1 Tax=Desulfofundulus thermobenzoicus TaxID=29376 RepID=A0A6N7ILI1_9FIRM|nr:hypothetical protein [Desulfofundulus thermobenzoicus]MQL50836.1 hypothetical protein [Desulfofundulus thermobenzoicus]
MASFVKTNLKVRRLKDNMRMCRRCNAAGAVFGGLCATCHEFAERSRRKELARRGKLKNGGLTGKPGPWPWREIEHQCQQIIAGRKKEE